MVAEYIQEMGHRLHPALPGELVFDPGTARWEQPKLSPDL